MMRREDLTAERARAESEEGNQLRGRVQAFVRLGSATPQEVQAAAERFVVLFPSGRPGMVDSLRRAGWPLDGWTDLMDAARHAVHIEKMLTTLQSRVDEARSGHVPAAGPRSGATSARAVELAGKAAYAAAKLREMVCEAPGARLFSPTYTDGLHRRAATLCLAASAASLGRGVLPMLRRCAAGGGLAVIRRNNAKRVAGKAGEVARAVGETRSALAAAAEASGSDALAEAAAAMLPDSALAWLWKLAERGHDEPAVAAMALEAPSAVLGPGAAAETDADVVRALEREPDGAPSGPPGGPTGSAPSSPGGGARAREPALLDDVGGAVSRLRDAVRAILWNDAASRGARGVAEAVERACRGAEAAAPAGGSVLNGADPKGKAPVLMMCARLASVPGVRGALRAGADPCVGAIGGATVWHAAVGGGARDHGRPACDVIDELARAMGPRGASGAAVSDADAGAPGGAERDASSPGAGGAVGGAKVDPPAAKTEDKAVPGACGCGAGDARPADAPAGGERRPLLSRLLDAVPSPDAGSPLRRASFLISPRAACRVSAALLRAGASPSPGLADLAAGVSRLAATLGPEAGAGRSGDATDSGADAEPGAGLSDDGGAASEHASASLPGLAQFFGSPELSDCVVVLSGAGEDSGGPARGADEAAGATLPAHRIVLAAASPFFRAKFSGEGADGPVWGDAARVDAPGAPVSVVRVALAHMYGAQASAGVHSLRSAQELVSLATLADAWLLPRLASEANGALPSVLTSDTAADAVSFALATGRGSLAIHALGLVLAEAAAGRGCAAEAAEALAAVAEVMPEEW